MSEKTGGFLCAFLCEKKRKKKMKKILGKFYCDIHRAILKPSGTMPADQAVEFSEADKANEEIKTFEAIEKKTK